MLQFVVDDVVLAVPEPRGYPVIFITHALLLDNE